MAYSLKASFCIRNASKWVFFNSEVIHCISFFWEAFLAILHIPDFCQVWWYLGPQVPDWIIHTSLKKMFSLFCLLLSSCSHSVTVPPEFGGQKREQKKTISPLPRRFENLTTPLSFTLISTFMAIRSIGFVACFPNNLGL